MICPSCKAANDDLADTCFTCGRALSALTRGSVIAGRYEVLKALGRGGMGMVYQAHDRMLDEPVAIKVLRPEFASTPEMAQRFRGEIKLARRVSHRNVCRIHEYGEDAGIRFISMELVEGVDVGRLARDNGGCVAPADAWDIAAQAADGLQAIHEAGIVHRDLKASNIMRDRRGVVRLMDFGIAKVDEGGGSGGALTSVGQVMGTPEYMSPELCRGERIDNRSDIYALGVVLYEMFTGSVPFRGETPVATLFRHIQEAVSFAGGAANRIPPAALPVLRRALAKDRNDRYPSAAAMGEALRRAQQQPAGGSPAQPATGSLPPIGSSRTGALPVPVERRTASRLDIPVSLVVRRVGTLGTVLQEERTIAENVGRGGARVMTTMASLSPGDVVQIEEVDGRFKTRAEVRGRYVGADGILRLNLRFVDSEAPDYLVHIDAPPKG